jgi:hypothetical protein
MSDRAMEMAMELFRSNADFQRIVRDSDDKGATVNRILGQYARFVPGEKFVGAAEDGLEPEEQAKINGLPWASEDNAQLIARIGDKGCDYA